MLKIDVFNHILPSRYLRSLPMLPRYLKVFPKGSSSTYGDKAAGLMNLQALYDVEVRFRAMDRYDGYVQILNVAEPPIEDIASPEAAVDLAKIANDEMAELVFKYPDRFMGAVACLPMNNLDAACKELDRAITELGFKGVQITTTIMDKPLDSPGFEFLFEKMAYYDLPILIHPRHMRSGPRAYPNNGEGITQRLPQRPFVWPYETTIAMGCLVYSGILNRYANLKVITHHCGGVTPYQAKRITRPDDPAENGQLAALGYTKDLVDYYKMIYADTAVWGCTPSLMCGYGFFGADHMVFGTDAPFDTREGDAFIRDTIQSVEEMDITEKDKRKIFEENARKLFHMPS